MSELVRAAVQTGPRQIELREFPRPVTGPDDGLLRIEASGICGSDAEQYKVRHGGRVVLAGLKGGRQPCGDEGRLSVAGGRSPPGVLAR